MHTEPFTVRQASLIVRLGIGLPEIRRLRPLALVEKIDWVQIGNANFYTEEAVAKLTKALKAFPPPKNAQSKSQEQEQEQEGSRVADS